MPLGLNLVVSSSKMLRPVFSTAIGSSVSANGAGTSATAYRGVRLVHLYDVSIPRGYISECALSEAESDT